MDSNSFKLLKISPEILVAIQNLGYLQMTPIQAASIPLLGSTQSEGESKFQVNEVSEFYLLFHSIHKVQALLIYNY